MKIKESFIFGMNCMFDLDAAAAQKMIQKIMDNMIDSQTHIMRIRDVSPIACFIMTGENLKASVKQLGTNRPELGRHFG